jgi:hypothetical protein
MILAFITVTIWAWTIPAILSSVIFIALVIFILFNHDEVGVCWFVGLVSIILMMAPWMIFFIAT